MSSDNLLIAIPAKNGQVALYDVFLSDLGVDLDGPHHKVCAYIARTYARRRVGVYQDHAAMLAAAKQYRHETIVEYGLHDFSQPPPKNDPAQGPKPGMN